MSNRFSKGNPSRPIYFARMKKVNKAGPDVLGSLPEPSRISAAELPGVLAAHEVVLLDLRGDRQAFMGKHVEGSLYAPLGEKFTSVAGSFVKPLHEVVLAVESTDDIEEAVRGLVRIGIDHIIGFVLLEEVLNGQATESLIVSTPVSSTAAIDDLREAHPDAVVLDVRTAAEFADGHVPGALNIAYTRLAKRFTEIPEGDLAPTLAKHLSP